MSEKLGITVERDWEQLRDDVNDCIDRLEEAWEADHDDMTEDQLEAFEDRCTGMVKLLALFCGGIETMFPDGNKAPTPEEAFHKKLFDLGDKSSPIH